MTSPVYLFFFQIYLHALFGQTQFTLCAVVTVTDSIKFAKSSGVVSLIRICGSFFSKVMGYKSACVDEVSLHIKERHVVESI